MVPIIFYLWCWAWFILNAECKCWISLKVHVAFFCYTDKCPALMLFTISSQSWGEMWFLYFRGNSHGFFFGGKQRAIMNILLSSLKQMWYSNGLWDIEKYENFYSVFTVVTQGKSVFFPSYSLTQNTKAVNGQVFCLTRYIWPADIW